MFSHYLGNRIVTLLTNVLYNTMLTDMETCYKVMRAEIVRGMTLQSNGFGIEPEMTAKIFKRGYRVYEIPITYDGRGYEQGKKITWRDGVVALWVLLEVPVHRLNPLSTAPALLRPLPRAPRWRPSRGWSCTPSASAGLAALIKWRLRRRARAAGERGVRVGRDRRGSTC